MKLEKQELILRVLASGRYIVNVVDGSILSYRKEKKCFEVMRPTVLPSGYLQYSLRLGGERIVVYGHIAVWLSARGVFEVGNSVVHLDDARGSNGIGNLQLRLKERYKEFNDRNKDCTLTGLRRMIRGGEIDDIRRLMGEGHKASFIARQLDLNRSSVDRIMGKIRRGETLFHENKVSAAI